MEHTTVRETVRMKSVLSSGRLIKRWQRDKWMYVLLLPGVLYFLVFKYVPMWGVVHKNWYISLINILLYGVLYDIISSINVV